MYKPVLALLAVCCIAVSHAGAQDKRMLLWLPFDAVDGDVSRDRSGHGNDATLHGDAGIDVGVRGNALTVGDKSWASVDHSPSFHLGTEDAPEMTLMCWVQIGPAVVGDDGQQMGIEKGVGWVAGEYSLMPDFVDNVIIQARDLDPACADQIKTQDIKGLGWRHVAGTFDGDTLRVHIRDADGPVAGSPWDMECPGPILTNDDPIFIGSRNGEVRFISGMMDDVCIFSWALSGDEIAQASDDPGRFALPVEARAALTTTWARIRRVTSTRRE